METILGMVEGKPSRTRTLILRNNGIRQRYYAMDRSGNATHTNAGMAAEAIRRLFDDQEDLKKIEVLAAGTGSMDHLVPSLAAMIHGELGTHPMEIISAQGTCCSSMQALKYAYTSIGSGQSRQAVCSGSERHSAYTRADRFQPEMRSRAEIEENPYLAFEKDFLRWMLSDGAAAAWLTDEPAPSGLSLRIEWIETTSYAHELETCMYAGAEKMKDGSLRGFHDFPPSSWIEQSIFSVKQDTRLLGEHIIKKGGDFLAELMKKHKLEADQIDHYLPHMSSMFFKSKIYDYQAKIGLEIPYEKWFYNLPSVGNVGSASPLLMLEELMASSRVQEGDQILVMVPESARFTYAYLYLTVVSS